MAQRGIRNAQEIVGAMRNIIEAEPLARIDYVKMVDFDTITKITEIEQGKTALCAIAVYIGKTRLIDNFIFRTSDN